MHRVQLVYRLLRDADAGAAHGDALAHPLFALLAAVRESGSIAGAARALGASYRHTWGELKRWDESLGQPVVRWAKGEPASLTPFGEKLLWAERRAQARLAPQIEALRAELERAFAVVFDAHAAVLTVHASHDAALPALRDLASGAAELHLDMQFVGSVGALRALNDGRCRVAGFHALADTVPGSPTARAFRRLLKPGLHKLIAFAERTQGLIVAPGNPLAIGSLADAMRSGVRFAHREEGAGSRIVLDELLWRQRIDAAAFGDAEGRLVEPSHAAVAEAVASGVADAAFGIEAAARRRGLDFVPLASERYFLACLKGALDEPAVQELRRLLASPAWREAIAKLPGYSPGDAGAVVPLTRALPWWRYPAKRAELTSSPRAAG